MTVTLARLVIALVGLIDVAAAVALLLVPAWFYQTVGEFPPFSRHYAGDAGAFLLGIGLALLLAATEPRRYLPVLYIGVAVSWLHALNHVYDALSRPGVGSSGFADAATIIAVAVVLTVAALAVSRPTGLFERTGRRA